MKANAIPLIALLSVTSALELDVTDLASIKSAASKIATNLVKTYPLDDTHLLPYPTYWWQTGNLLETFSTYMRYTKDKTTFPLSSINAAFTHQIGDDNFMPWNHSARISNDDQSYWALAAMTGVENEMLEDSQKFEKAVENAWNAQALRWDDKTCGGGLRWWIFTFQKGYDYKNSASNMNFFLLSARLAAYTDNSTYADWAGKVYDWSEEVGLIRSSGEVFAGAMTGDDCKEINKRQWSANAATAAYGAAIMETLNTSGNVTQWKERKTTLLTEFTNAFTDESVFTESACESVATCTADMKASKGIAARHLSKIAQLDAANGAKISKIMEASAKAVAASCQDDGTCGFVWTDSKFDNDTGVNQQMNALNVITGLLASKATGSEKDTESATDASETATGTAPSATGTDAASGTATGPAAVTQTGAASSFGAVNAGWGIGAFALGVAALL